MSETGPFTRQRGGECGSVSVRSLSASGRDLLLIATKSDRLSGNQLRNALKTLGEEYPAARILAYSAKSSVGREELWKRIREAAQRFWLAEPSSQASPD